MSEQNAPKRGRQCLCDSRYDGCDHPRPCGARVADARRGPWCAECNPRRIAHIDKALTDLLSPGETR